MENSGKCTYLQKKIVKSRCRLGYSAEIRVLYCKFQKVREMTSDHLYKGLDQSTKGFLMFGTGFKRRMGMILHFRQTHMAPDETYGKALGCDICDAFLVINGFSSYDELVDHTESVHGAVSSLPFFSEILATFSCNFLLVYKVCPEK